MDVRQRIDFVAAPYAQTRAADQEERRVGAELGGNAEQIARLDPNVPEFLQREQSHGGIAAAPAQTGRDRQLFGDPDANAKAYAREIAQQFRGAISQVRLVTWNFGMVAMDGDSLPG